MSKNNAIDYSEYNEILLEFNSNVALNLMLGEHSKNLIKLQETLNISLEIFGNQIRIYGKKHLVKITEALLNKIYQKVVNEQNGVYSCDFSIFETELRMLKLNKVEEDEDLILKTWKKSVVAKSIGQKNYLKALNNHELVFGLGPAGTGKSYLAVAKGIELLKNGFVEKIILSRPAVEAGENLGFLPGDMKEKVDPYLRPIYDALYEMIPIDRVQKKIQNGGMI